MNLLSFVLAAQMLAASGWADVPHDVAIFANVRAKELRFEVVPTVTVRATVHESERTNLPDEVQPHVTYRDIGIRLTITSTLPDIEQILDEALSKPPEEDP